jgi:predicted ATP-binding protein involved in virulence
MSKIFIEKVIIKNRAPFGDLCLDFKENEIAVLTAVNGRGKTALLSYIVDAWHEMARTHFRSTFKDRVNQFYRISSNTYDIDKELSSHVYIRFQFQGKKIDYVDIRNGSKECISQEEDYERIIQIENKIPFNWRIKGDLEKSGFVKHASNFFDEEDVRNIFNNNIITYFPSYRYEQPGYLSDPYKVDLKFSKEISFSDSLENPIEVVSGLPQFANWIMDVVLDMKLDDEEKYKQGYKAPDFINPGEHLWHSLNDIITKTLSSKNQKALRFAIGGRNAGHTRISIIQQEDGKEFYPTVFNLSSGESAILCMFGEILRQADNNQKDISLSEITGIVLIDEVDKHLHIKLQKEVLPELFNLFPNVQFILSSHSPFLNMGLAESNRTKVRVKIIDLDRNGLVISPQENELYKEVYEMMIKENENYAKSHRELLSTKKPILFVEDTYTQIYKVAWLKLHGIEFNQNDLDSKFDDAPFCIFGKGNDNNLQGFLDNPCMDEWKDKIIAGLFDFDDAYKNYQKLKEKIAGGKWEVRSDNERAGLYKKRSDYEVYALMLPIPEHRKKIAGKDQQVKQLEVELLLSDEKIEEIFGGSDYATDKIIDDIYIPKIKNKSDFWKKTLKLQSEDFAAFRPLFSTLSIIFNLNK